MFLSSERPHECYQPRHRADAGEYLVCMRIPGLLPVLRESICNINPVELGLSQCHDLSWSDSKRSICSVWFVFEKCFFFFMYFRCTWWTLRMCQSRAAPPPNSTPFQCFTSTTTPTSSWRSTKTWWCAPAAATDPAGGKVIHPPKKVLHFWNKTSRNAIKDLLLHTFLSAASLFSWGLEL